jgi:hypothetical protein
MIPLKTYIMACNQINIPKKKLFENNIFFKEKKERKNKNKNQIYFGNVTYPLALLIIKHKANIILNYM